MMSCILRAHRICKSTAWADQNYKNIKKFGFSKLIRSNIFESQRLGERPHGSTAQTPVASIHLFFINTLAPGHFRGFGKKNTETHVALWAEFLQISKCYGPGRSVKIHGQSSSLHSKKFIWLRVWIFCEWRHKWTTFRPLWPTLPGPGRQPLGGSISLKFLLETRL